MFKISSRFIWISKCLFGFHWYLFIQINNGKFFGFYQKWKNTSFYCSAFLSVFSFNLFMIVSIESDGQKIILHNKKWIEPTPRITLFMANQRIFIVSRKNDKLNVGTPKNYILFHWQFYGLWGTTQHRIAITSFCAFSYFPHFCIKNHLDNF